MAQPKQLRTDRGQDGKDMPDGHRVTIDEINRMIISSPKTCSVQIGEFLLDTVFSGDPKRVLSRNRRTAAGIKKASCKPSMPQWSCAGEENSTAQTTLMPQLSRNWPLNHRSRKGSQQTRKDPNMTKEKFEPAKIVGNVDLKKGRQGDQR